MTSPTTASRSYRSSVWATLLLIALVVALAGLAPAPAEASGADARLTKLKVSIRNAQQASSTARHSLAVAEGEASPVRDRAAQAARRAEAADATVAATAEAARNSAAGLAAAQVASDAARASADAAANQANAAAGQLAAAQQGAASAAQVQWGAQVALDAAGQTVAAAQGDLDQEKSRWFSCTSASGRFMCRKNKVDDYQPVPKLDQIFARRDAAQQVKDARYHELYSANQACAEWAARVQQTSSALTDAQAVAGAAAAARDRAQAAQVAALAKRDETAAISARALSEAATAGATAETTLVAAQRAQVGVDLLREDAVAAAGKLTRAKQHLRYVRRQLARS